MATKERSYDFYAFEDMDATATWSVRLYTSVETDDTLRETQFIPAHVLIHPLGEADPKVFWNPQFHAKVKAPAVDPEPPAPADAPVVEEAFDLDSIS